MTAPYPLIMTAIRIEAAWQLRNQGWQFWQIAEVFQVAESTLKKIFNKKYVPLEIEKRRARHRSVMQTYRECWYLRYKQDMTYEQIGRLYGISKQAARQRFRRQNFQPPENPY